MPKITQQPQSLLEKQIRQSAGKVVRKIRKSVLRPFVKKYLSRRRDDINVVMVIRNRDAQRMANALRSIREQSYAQALIDITVVDYDSEKSLAPIYNKLCMDFNANYIRVDNQPVWCKSHGLNIAIKSTTATYTLSSDVDIIFEQSYIQEAIDALRHDAFRVVFSDFLNLPPMRIDKLDIARLKKLAAPRWNTSEYSAPIPLALTWFFKLVRGYDEQYKYWGKEDDDLAKRFYMLGLDKYFLERSFLLHQWHPEHYGVSDEDFEKHLEKNTRYYDRTHSVIRNRGGWADWDGSGKVKMCM